jgi:hypothetical protein
MGRRTLDIDDDATFQERWWRVQLTSTALLLLVIVVALAGGLGRGLFTRKTIDQPSAGIHLHYERIAHVRAPMVLEVELDANALRPEKTSVTLGWPLLRSMLVEHVVPEPLETHTGSEGLEFVFGTQPSTVPTPVQFTLRPARSGRIPARVSVQGSPPIDAAIVVLP